MKNSPVIASLVLLMLFVASSPTRADDPVTTINGGIRGTVKNHHVVEWTNNTLHKLKFTFTLTMDDQSTGTGTTTLDPKQNLQDLTTITLLHTITRIQITHIDLVD